MVVFLFTWFCWRKYEKLVYKGVSIRRMVYLFAENVVLIRHIKTLFGVFFGCLPDFYLISQSK